METKIPKIIHQIYWDFSDGISPPSNKWLIAQQSWKVYHPDWKYMYWNDIAIENFIGTFYPWFLDIFSNYPHPIQRADAVRPFLLYHYGGIYADMDTVCKKSFK